MLFRVAASLALTASLSLVARLAPAQTCALAPPAFAGHNFPSVGSPLDSADFEVTNAFPALTFTRPVFLTSAPDGTDRIFVVEQAGRVRVFPNDPGVTASKLFLDLTSLVQSQGNEQGLLGLAFDPAYAANGYFYVNYTAPASSCLGGRIECTKIVRYRVSGGDPDAADPFSALELLEYAQPDNDHNGGMLAFGPDGMLYIASGDGGDNQDPNGQNLTTRLGKILRIDPARPAPYIPPDNPFAGDPTKAREIWLYGLRNPWRFSFDRASGDLWIGDVGQNAWEEIDLIPAGSGGGANLGWNVCEGSHNFAGDCAALGALAPVLEYSHGSGMGNVVVGGYVYRGASSPGIQGVYFFTDADSGRIFAWDRVSPPVDVGNVPFPSSFGEDQNGEIYVLGLFDGRVYRIEHTPGGGPGEFPALLSQTGLFSNAASLTPAPGMVEYEVAVPFWSDNAIKRRWVALPAGGRARFHADAAWELPAGTALVKHFDIPTGPGQKRRLETRVLLHQPASQGAPARWLGVTYRWNGNQTDATLLTTGLDEVISVDPGTGLQSQNYHYPASWECLQCHNGAAGDVLGLRTAQMNRSFAYPSGAANQLSTWWCAGMLDADPGNPALHDALVDPANTSAPLVTRARAWLDVNCSMCHRPGGPAPGGLDLRRQPLLAGMNVIDVPPTEGDLGIAGARRIRPGSRAQSILWARVQSAQPGVHMPPQGRAADPFAVDLLGTWIDTALFVLDSEGDGASDDADNCPYYANPGQGDADGDGRGDLCECSDQSGDGRVTVSDLIAINAAIFNPGSVTPLCDGNGDRRCNVSDLVAANLEIFVRNSSVCARQPVPGP
jgi:uncharacterized repeat protein (TIGR03806 family)